MATVGETYYSQAELPDHNSPVYADVPRELFPSMLAGRFQRYYHNTRGNIPPSVNEALYILGNPGLHALYDYLLAEEGSHVAAVQALHMYQKLTNPADPSKRLDQKLVTKLHSQAMEAIESSRMLRYGGTQPVVSTNPAPASVQKNVQPQTLPLDTQQMLIGILNGITRYGIGNLQWTYDENSMESGRNLRVTNLDWESANNITKLLNSEGIPARARHKDGYMVVIPLDQPALGSGLRSITNYPYDLQQREMTRKSILDGIMCAIYQLPPQQLSPEWLWNNDNSNMRICTRNDASATSIISILQDKYHITARRSTGQPNVVVIDQANFGQIYAVDTRYKNYVEEVAVLKEAEDQRFASRIKALNSLFYKDDYRIDPRGWYKNPKGGLSLNVMCGEEWEITRKMPKELRDKCKFTEKDGYLVMTIGPEGYKDIDRYSHSMRHCFAHVAEMGTRAIVPAAIGLDSHVRGKG